MTTGPRVRPSGGRRGSGGGFTRRRRGRSTLKTEEIDYKDVQLMRRFVSERGKIISGGRIGVTAKNQRRLARAIKRAQHLALVPIAPNHTYVTGAIQTEAQQRQQEAPASESEATEETSEQTEEVVSQDETPVAQTEDSASDEPASESPTSEESTADDAQSDESEAPPEAETSDD